MKIREIEGVVTRKELCALVAAVEAVLMDFMEKMPLVYTEFESYNQLKNVWFKLKKVMEDIDC